MTSLVAGASAPVLSLPFVSVIVPVFHDEPALRRCLRALAAQSYPPALYEVVVVDNGGNPQIERIARRFRRVTVVREPAAGAYAARNRGAAVARGEVLAFTDADCIPDRAWLERAVRALDGAPRCGLVAGRIDLFARDPRRPRPSELYETAAAFRQKDYVERWRFGATANLMTRRDVFETVGGFDGRLRSLGDREWGRRVFQAGYDLVYADDAVVRHPARASLFDLWRRAARTAGGFFDLVRTAGYPARAAWRDAPVGLVPARHLVGRPRTPADTPWGMRERVTVAAVALSVILVRVAELARRAAGGRARRR
ncbi:MAG TPA: glycosyltransferase [Vicinamibacteria bacterium]